MVALVAKPTIWKKYTFRSQLEARWAFFFDFLGIRYLYEPKLVCLSRPGLEDLWYRFDFYLPDHHAILEMKGEKPEQREKMRLLAKQSRLNVYTFYGDVGTPIMACKRGAFVDYGDDYYFQLDEQPTPIRIRYPLIRPGQLITGQQSQLVNAYGRWSDGHGWSECLTCGMIVIGSTDPTIRWQCACPEPLKAAHTAASPRLLAAYSAANQHHFSRAELPAATSAMQRAS
ncbi:MAG: hypothetical protein H0U76_22360 [Ktedonobacteraceae bacterium]|nr:hypothetical protein [Ktedonobacteraceae bacterium]